MSETLFDHFAGRLTPSPQVIPAIATQIGKVLASIFCALPPAVNVEAVEGVSE